MKLMQEFKDFAVKGNVIDMAVGIIIGAGFGKIVSSLVADVVMPPVGMLLGGVDFSDLRIVLSEAKDGVAAVSLNYGVFIQTVIDFTIVAFCVFMLVKVVQSLKRQQATAAATPPPPSHQELLLAEIRDLLRDSRA